MWFIDSSSAAPISSVLTGNRCPLHSRANSLVPHSVSKYQRMQHQDSCMLQAPIAARLRRTSVRPSYPEPASCGWPNSPYTIAHDRLIMIASIGRTPCGPATSHSGSLVHQCLPLDRRWQGRPSVQCLSDAVGPIGGSSEAEHDGTSSQERSMQEHASQVCGSALRLLCMTRTLHVICKHAAKCKSCAVLRSPC